MPNNRSEKKKPKSAKKAGVSARNPAPRVSHGEEEPKLQHRLWSRVVDAADDAIISIDQRQCVVLFNRGAERIFGWQARDVIGKQLDVLLPKEHAGAHRRHVEEFSHAGVEARRMAERSEIAGRRRNGKTFPAEASISQVDYDGSKIFTVILRDITERKAADQKIRDSLREKEVLLKEIHHRVKNNLQVVSSLLNLQSRSIPDEESRKFFRESQHRVHSMALIHEQLYESENLSQIDFPEYVRQLVAYLFRAYGVSLSRVDLETRIDPVSFGVDVAVPCGLIINELVSNSLKYAFPEGKTGKVRLDLRKRPHSQVTLTVLDTGIGFPSNVSLLNTRTLGLRLVRSLAQQLDGKAEIKNRGGAQVRIRFAAS